LSYREDFEFQKKPGEPDRERDMTIPALERQSLEDAFAKRASLTQVTHEGELQAAAVQGEQDIRRLEDAFAELTTSTQVTHESELKAATEQGEQDIRRLEDAFAELTTSTQVTHESELQAATDQSEHDVRGLNEKLVISNERLAAANTDLETFSYSVAHDLRSPIRQIAGFSRILLEEYGPQLPAEARRYLDKVEQGARQMGLLVDDLLHLAQVGRQALSLQLTSLNSILAAALEPLRTECSGRNVEWRIGDLCSVACDQGLMKQALVNLLSNALKYTRPRDPAVIQVGQMTLNGEQVVFVRDNGVGFDMQYAGNLFGVFHRLHLASEFEGTGIGLATVERIIRKHGGRIWAHAEPGRGATFFFTVRPDVLSTISEKGFPAVLQQPLLVSATTPPLPPEN
jgi:signal transduction histidine kinase